MLRTLLDRARRHGSSVQFEVQRMTPAGGWINFYTEFVDDDTPTAFDQPPDPPSFGSETGYPEGRYRCIERRDGRLHTVVWTVESPSAEQYYQDERAKARERAQIEELSAREFCHQLTEFTALTSTERVDLLDEKRETEQADRAPASFEDQLMQEVLEGNVDTEDLEDVKRVALAFSGDLDEEQQ